MMMITMMMIMSLILARTRCNVYVYTCSVLYPHRFPLFFPSFRSCFFPPSLPAAYLSTLSLHMSISFFPPFLPFLPTYTSCLHDPLSNSHSNIHAITVSTSHFCTSTILFGGSVPCTVSFENTPFSSQ